MLCVHTCVSVCAIYVQWRRGVGMCVYMCACVGVCACAADELKLMVQVPVYGNTSAVSCIYNIYIIYIYIYIRGGPLIRRPLFGRFRESRVAPPPPPPPRSANWTISPVNNRDQQCFDGFLTLPYIIRL